MDSGGGGRESTGGEVNSLRDSIGVSDSDGGGGINFSGAGTGDVRGDGTGLNFETVSRVVSDTGGSRDIASSDKFGVIGDEKRILRSGGSGSGTGGDGSGAGTGDRG